MNSVNLEIIELLKSLDNQLKNFSLSIINIRKSGNQIIKNIKGYYLENGDDFFTNLKMSFKNYYESIINFYDNVQIKNLLSTLNDKINIFENNKNYLKGVLLLNEELTNSMNNDSNNHFYVEYNELIDNNPNFYDDNTLINKNFDKKYFFYTINIVSENPIDFDESLLDQFKEQINEEKSTLLLSKDDKKNVLNSLIKSNEYIQNYSDIKEINKIAEIINFLNNKCGVYNIEYLGNKITFNSSLKSKRGNEKYYPPNDWIGIGITVTGKYNEDIWLNDSSKSAEWAIAYHQISSYEVIKKIIEEGLKPGRSQDKEKEKDIRNQRQLIGEGIYLYPEISLAEEKAPNILINNRRYKIVIMAKVMIQKIRQPAELNYWILDKNSVRPYRILFKENKEQKFTIY